MDHRTNIQHQTVIAIPDQGVTLDFVEQGKIKFTLAANSKWHLPIHWHSLHTGCHQIHCLQGRMLVSWLTPEYLSGSAAGGPGANKRFTRGDLHVWKSRIPAQELIVLLEADDEALLRNMTGAMLDAARFPLFSSTPFWLRLLYRLSASSPVIQRRIIIALLWVQLQMMYSAYDFRMHHGSFGVLFLWLWTHLFAEDRPPRWVLIMEWWSIRVRSIAMHAMCY